VSLHASDEKTQITRGYSNRFGTGGLAPVFRWGVVARLEVGAATMPVHLNLAALRQTKWYEYAVRFLFGGAITVITGLIAKHYGPVFGGLFLAFPAIFPASATLIEAHEKRKRLSAGKSETMRGRFAAALDARGAAFGTIGLAFFALTVWKLLPHWNTGATLLVALGVWFILSVLVWYLRKSCRKSGHTSSGT
jgi:hypothetical protein